MSRVGLYPIRLVSLEGKTETHRKDARPQNPSSEWQLPSEDCWPSAEARERQGRGPAESRESMAPQSPWSQTCGVLTVTECLSVVVSHWLCDTLFGLPRESHRCL